MICLLRYKRRFNIVVLPTPASLETEIEIVESRVRQLSASLDLYANAPQQDVVEQVVTISGNCAAGARWTASKSSKQPAVFCPRRKPFPF